MSGELEASHPAIVGQFGAILSRIAHGETEPRAGLGELVAAYQGSPQLDQTRYVGDEYGIALLYGYYYNYDDLEERPSEVSFRNLHGHAAVEALNAEVIRISCEWLSDRRAILRSGA